MGMLIMIYYAGITSTQQTQIMVTEVQRGVSNRLSPDEFPVTSASLPTFREVASMVNASVVYIETEVPFNRRQLPDDGNHEFDDNTIDRFFPRRRASTIGSGVLVSPDGYIITNNHVIAGADGGTIRVTLNDKRVFNARVVGRDPSTDLAALKIDSADLPHAIIGNSDYVEVGDWVLAVGNPFRLRSTVTAGIVSALGRNVDIIADQMRIESFIQTDAAINRGNSGGALVNQYGELIGINTAIATENGGNQGYGFAIPINMAFKITQDLIEFGEINRGFLGINIVSVGQDRAQQLGLPRIKGVEIVNILRNSTAESGGLRNNDVILSVDGFQVNEANHLQERVALRRPGDEVTLEVWRGGRTLQFDVRLSGLN